MILGIVKTIMALLLLLHPPSKPKPKPVVTKVKVSRGTERTGLNWAALRQCESGGNYGNKKNPKYRGAYQFSYSTWRSVGGSGDPADASVEEQDHRARILYQRSGRGQWPVCGRLL